MRQTLKIARNELYTLYYSPIAWAIMIIFIIMTSLDYTGELTRYLHAADRGGIFLRYVTELTNTIISNRPGGYFNGIISNLYIFFPLITMGLISREKSKGTMRLLYSSPVKMPQIVMGKFLAMVVFTIALLALVFLTLIALSLSLAHPDFGHMFASLVGLFFVLCTYAAIGLFISSLTSYAIVAAIATFAVFALFSHLGGILSSVELARNVTFYLNMPLRSRPLLQGLLNSRDLIYFVIITGAFLGFTMLKLKAATESVSAWLKGGRYVAVIVVAVAVGYVSSRPALTGYWDSSRDQIHTITPPTQHTLARLDKGPLDITIYVNLLSFQKGRFSPRAQNGIMYSVLGPYIRFKSNTKVKFVYYYADSKKDVLGGIRVNTFTPPSAKGKTPKERAKKAAKQEGIDFSRVLDKQQVNKRFDVASEGLSNFFVLGYQGKHQVVRTFNDFRFWPSENEMAAAFKRFIRPSPEIVFLSGHGERSPFKIRRVSYHFITSAKKQRHSLINQGYNIDTLLLKDTKAIPTDIAGLAIVDPEQPYSSADLAKIKAYLRAGGNLFVAGSPDHRKQIQPVLGMLGLSLHPGRLAQTNKHMPANIITGYLAPAAQQLSPQYHRALKRYTKYRGDSTYKVRMKMATALEYKKKGLSGQGKSQDPPATPAALQTEKAGGFTIKPLVVTDSAKSWIRRSLIPRDSLHKKLDKPAGAPNGPFTTVLMMKRSVHKTNQTVIAAGDADYLTRPSGFTYGLGFWSFSKFSNGQYPANTMRHDTDHKFSIGLYGRGPQKILLIYVTPILLLILGSVLIIRRRRK